MTDHMTQEEYEAAQKALGNSEAMLALTRPARERRARKAAERIRNLKPARRGRIEVAVEVIDD